jgi:TP901 family phage tail tape measure protein
MAKLVSVGSEFQNQMSNVRAFVNGTDAEFQQLSDTAESLGASTSFSAAQAAAAMTEMGKAGLTANQILGASEGVLTLAAAGDIEMAEAATIAAAALNQFGIPAAEMGSVVDRLAKAASSGSISLSGMGTQLSYASASATAFGMDLGETSGIIATLATALGEDKAGTGFRAMMSSLQAPTAGAAQQLAALGISLTDSAGNFLTLPAIVDQFNTALSGMASGEKAAAMSAIFDTRGVGAFSTLMRQGAAGMREMTASVNDSDGFGLSVAEEKLDNVSGAFTKLQSAASGMAIDIFQTFQGPLQAALEGTANFISGPMITGFQTFMEWMGAFATVAEFAWNNFGALAGLAALKALSAMTTLSEDIQHFFGTNMGEVFDWLFTNWTSIWSDMAAVTLGVLENIGQNVRNVFSAVWETVTSLGETPLTFDMVPLLDGVQTVTAGLELTQRTVTADERDYQREIEEIGSALNGNFEEFLNSTFEDIGSMAAGADQAAVTAGAVDFDASKSAAGVSAAESKSNRDPLGIAFKGSKDAFDVINRAIKGSSDNHLKTVAKQAEKQTALQQKQVDLLEDMADVSDVEVVSI